MTHLVSNAVIGLLGVLAVAIGWTLLRRALARAEVLPEEVALGLAWVFVVGSFVWLRTFLDGSSLLGFQAPWTWLAAAHFAAAGFGALTITALACRVVSEPRWLRILRVLLVVHPLAYLVIAAGISRVPYCDELGTTLYELLFVTQLSALVLGRPNRIERGPLYLLVVSLCVPVCTMVLAIAWAWGIPFFDLGGMVRYHGLVNAIGHVGLGLAAFAWGKPAAHSPMLEVVAHQP